jgi:molybdenum cofactor cytidylyltransferase
MLCAAIILAGGRSERMSHPKPFLHFDQRTFLQKGIEAYRRAGISQVYVVLNVNCFDEDWKAALQKVEGSATIIRNDEPGKGRFYSLRLGVAAARQADYCFFQNVDNPFIDHNLVRKILRHRNEAGYVLPVCKGRGGHPVLLNKEIIRDIGQHSGDEITIRDFLATYNRKEILLTNEAVLVNMNDRATYYREMLKYEVLQYI